MDRQMDRLNEEAAAILGTDADAFLGQLRRIGEWSGRV
jgi:hypothetical protein